MNKKNDILKWHENLRVPEYPQNDELANWVEDLYEIDPYYFGLAESLVRGGIIKAIDRSHFEKLENSLKNIKINKEDFPIYEQCVNYLASLKRVISLLD